MRTYGLICYSLLDRCKTEGKSIDFLPIWLRVDPGATFIFITQIRGGVGGGGAEKCHTCFASLHDNKDHPSQRRSGRWREANLCSLRSFMKCPPLTVSLSLSVHHLCYQCSFSSSTGNLTYFTFTTIFCFGPVQIPTSARKTFDGTFG